MRIFAFHHAGGAGDAFRGWTDALPPEIETWAFDLPGHGRRIGEPFATSIPALADELAGAMADLVAELPYALFGYSLGARVAFELAARLERRGARAPARLFVASDLPPDQRPRRPMIWELDDERFADWIRSLEGTPPAILENPDMMDFFLPIFRSDFELYDRYEPAPGARVSAPVTALAGERDAIAPPALAAGWSRFSSTGFRLVSLDAGHFVVQEAARRVVDEIAADLADAAAPARPLASAAPAR